MNWAVAEMTRRYQLLAEYNVRDLAGYNQKVEMIQDIEDENKPQDIISFIKSKINSKVNKIREHFDIKRYNLFPNFIKQ